MVKGILKERPYKDYVLKNDVLFKNKSGLMLFVVPRLMGHEIIKTEHEKGHFATEKIVNAVCLALPSKINIRR